MAYVPVPKDLMKVKTKVMFNLTKRQLICFSAGAIIGLPFFFLLRDKIGVSAASLLMIFSMLPCFLLAIYEKNGQPLERIARHFIQCKFVRPKQRPYKTDNFYAVLVRQDRLDWEVAKIMRLHRRI